MTALIVLALLVCFFGGIAIGLVISALIVIRASERAMKDR